MLLVTGVGAVATIYALSVLLTPVTVASRTLRLYHGHRTIPNLPTDIQDEAGQLLRNLQEMVMQANRVEQDLMALSKQDHLTSTLNRRAGEEQLATDTARAQHSRLSLTVAVVDGDQLKAVNDRYGHDAGDVGLQHLAAALGVELRQMDWISRWGGDEFVIGFWNAEPRRAEVALHRVRAH